MKRGHIIVRNAAKCKKCGQILESKHVHDFVPCMCFVDSNGADGIAVDGGHEYLRRVGNVEMFEDMSETRLMTDEERNEYNIRAKKLYEEIGWYREEME